MRRGFEFDAALCVRCNACNAACTLENGFQPGTRSLYGWNDAVLPAFSVYSLSLACNHCEKPECLEGCPVNAYSKNISGVVLYDKDKCMGCRYCTWRCPYDAPRINTALGHIEKCQYCFARVSEGVETACASACPTGALRMASMDEFPPVGVAWFPETGIGPSLILKGVPEGNSPLIIPAEEDEVITDAPVAEKKVMKEWSLILFSLMVISASSLLIASALKADVPWAGLPAILMAGSILVSFAHLGLPLRAWRAPLNVLSSPLSREIMLVMILSGMAAVNWFIPGVINPVLMASVSLLTLISVDMVYFAADRSYRLKLHTGQAFFSAVFVTSWFITPNTLFLLFSLLAALSVVMRYRSSEKEPLVRFLYYYRALSLPASFMLLYPGSEAARIAAAIVFFTGVAADRVLFYDDFSPVNIRESILENFNDTYEKERDKQRQDAGIS
jgi:Fe-S-cluster-containing dehydrogenase component